MTATDVAAAPSTTDHPVASLARAARVRPPIWWRFVGLLTVVVALVSAETVWKVNRHVSRLELGRIFAMAMSQPRVQQRPKPVVRPRPTPRPKPQPKPEPEASPLHRNLDPMSYINPMDEAQALPTVEPEPEPPPPPPQPEPEPEPDPAQQQAMAMQQTAVSEVTRQAWVLICMVLLELVALAGLSAVLDMRRARRNLILASLFLIGGTLVTFLAVRVITRGVDVTWVADWSALEAVEAGGGYPPLVAKDLLNIALRGSGFALVLLILQMLPQARRYSRARRHRPMAMGLWGRLFGHPAVAGVWLLLVAVLTAVVAVVSSGFSFPAWHLIRLIPLGWSGLALLAGLLCLTGRGWACVPGYAVSLIGVVVMLLCWGAPFVVVGPVKAIQILMVLLPAGLLCLTIMRYALRVSLGR